MASNYNSADIEVLSGLDPVRKRPGMYTDTTRPNHMAQEVIDNSVDEAIAGFATKIEVVLYKDGSLSVSDDGRGMPVDLHPEKKRPGVEVVLSTLHAGGKFSSKSYKFSGGLHGVGISVVNALSKHLEVWVRRDGKEYNIAFADGELSSELEEVGTVGKRNTGTVLRFWPDSQYFDTVKFSLSRLKQQVVGKATREDHSQIMNTMIRFYSQGKEAETKQEMAFDLSSFDRKTLRFKELFVQRFMDISVKMRLNDALDLCWQTLAECFEANELLMKQNLVDRYYGPAQERAERSH